VDPRPRRQSALEEARRAARWYFSATRLKVLIGAGLAAVGLAVLLYPSFPGIDTPADSAMANDKGAALLAEAISAHGGAERFRAHPMFELSVSDQWEKLFEAFSFWPGYSTTADLVVHAAEGRYKARFGFRDGTAWGFDGDRAWVAADDGVRRDSPVIPRARFASWTVSRLVLLPFSIAIEGAPVQLLQSFDGERPGVVAVDFPRPGRPGHTDRWMLFFDAKTRRLAKVVYETSASNAPVIESCLVTAEARSGDLVLPARFECAMSNRLSLPLHVLELKAHKQLEELSPMTFLPPQPAKTGEPIVNTEKQEGR
jgi:hypothetical protein